MVGFDIEKDNLKEAVDFKDSIFEKMGLSKYLCPKCGANLKESYGELICLNACHLSEQSQRRFSRLISSVKK